MQIYILAQTHNCASIPPLSFLQAGCPSCRQNNSVKELKAQALKATTVTRETIMQLPVYQSGCTSRMSVGVVGNSTATAELVVLATTEDDEY